MISGGNNSSDFPETLIYQISNSLNNIKANGTTRSFVLFKAKAVKMLMPKW